MIDKYSADFYQMGNEQIEKLEADSKNATERVIIKNYIDRMLTEKYPDTSSVLVNQLKLSAIGYFCLREPAYRSIFLRALELYTQFLQQHYPDKLYDNAFLNILRYKAGRKAVSTRIL